MSGIRPLIAPLLACLTCMAGCHVKIALGPIESDDQRLAAAHDQSRRSQKDSEPRASKSKEDTARPQPNPLELAGFVGKPVSEGWRATTTHNDKIVQAQFGDKKNDSPGTKVEPNNKNRLNNVVQRVTALREQSEPPIPPDAPARPAAPAPPDAVSPLDANDVDLSSADQAAVENHPIDLPTVLRLAGAENWDIQLAAERVHESYVELGAAKALWLPSLVAGVTYTKHDGQIQDTRGAVVDVSRNALFVGGGARVSNHPLTGSSGGPARLFVDFSVTDAFYEPLVARQLTGVAHARHSAAYNDTLLEASLAFYELIRSQGQLANALANVQNAEQLARLTEAFVASGKGSRADTARVRTELTTRKRQIVEAEVAIKIASAELARILRLDAQTTLFSLEETALPVELIVEQTPLAELVARGLNFRPEIAESLYQLEARRQRVQAERMRPLIPSIFVGASTGGFGGGRGDTLNQLDGRADFDIGAVWELRNLGLGTRSDQRRSSSQYRQSLFESHRVRESVTTEITQAYHQVQANRRRITLAESNVQEALESLQQNLARIRGLEGLPLEALQAIQAVAQSSDDYLDAVVSYNRSQAQLLQAAGRPIDESP